LHRAAVDLAALPRIQVALKPRRLCPISNEANPSAR
jgi:hypothetical protein